MLEIVWIKITDQRSLQSGCITGTNKSRDSFTLSQPITRGLKMF